MRIKTQWEVYKHDIKHFSRTKWHVFHLLPSVLKEIDGNSERATLIQDTYVGVRIWILVAIYGHWGLEVDGDLQTG